MNVMNYYHIEYCATCYCKQHVLVPEMKNDTGKNAKHLWKSVIASEEGYIFQTINHQHTKDCTREVFAQKLHKTRCVCL